MSEKLKLIMLIWRLVINCYIRCQAKQQTIPILLNASKLYVVNMNENTGC